MSLQSIITPEISLFPSTDAGFKLFCKKLSANLESASNGQIRRKESWIAAQVAKSLPYQHESFNINTLKAIMAKAESIGFSDAVEAFKSETSTLESDLCEIGLQFLSSYENQVCVGLDYDDDSYYVLHRRALGSTLEEPKIATCNCHDCEECEECILEPMGGGNKLESICLAIACLNTEAPSLIDMMEQSEPIFPKVTYLVTLQDSEDPYRIENIKVIINDDGANVEDKIKARVASHLREDGERDDMRIINYTPIEALPIA